jgi:hypothetical protein
MVIVIPARNEVLVREILHKNGVVVTEQEDYPTHSVSRVGDIHPDVLIELQSFGVV